jgi:hypothetical protein
MRNCGGPGEGRQGEECRIRMKNVPRFKSPSNINDSVFQVEREETLSSSWA